MNDKFLIVLLVLMAATFVKVVVGAIRSKKPAKNQQKQSNQIKFIVQPTPKSVSEKCLLVGSSVLVRPTFASSYILIF